MDAFTSSLDALRIPQGYTKLGEFTEEDVINQLETWKSSATTHLLNLRQLVLQEDRTISQEAKIVASVAPFDAAGPWTTVESRQIAAEILALYTENTELIQRVLQNHVKPLFRSNPHPSLHLETARKLVRPAGGLAANQDMYEDQAWKCDPGAGNLVLWCVKHIKSDTYERLWPLVVPPMMILLDDYEGAYKLEGVQIASAFLANVPTQILKRTGVDTLIIDALTKSLTHLDRPETPFLVRCTIPTMLTLIDKVTIGGSSDRFDRLSSLMGDSIVGGIWLYSGERLETMIASVDMIPLVVQALGIGTARFLKALIPQLLHPLLLPPISSPSIPLQLSSCSALVAVIQQCRALTKGWKGTVLDGVARRWVNLHDAKEVSVGGDEKDEELKLKDGLRKVFASLVDACPSVLEEEYARLLELDEGIFKPLAESTAKGTAQ